MCCGGVTFSDFSTSVLAIMSYLSYHTLDHYSATIDTSFTPSSFLHDILDVQSASTTNTAVNDPAAL